MYLLATAFLIIPLLSAIPTQLSNDGTFALTGSDALATDRFSRSLSVYEKQFHQVTGYPHGDAPPIIVVLHDTVNLPGGRAALRVDAVEGNSLRIQVDVTKDVMGDPSTSLKLVQAILLREYYNGKAPLSGSRIPDFPPWLLHGLGKLSKPDAKIAEIPSSYLKGSAPPTIADFLIQKSPDDSNGSLLDIYDSTAANLLIAGLKSTGGEKSFQDWIARFDPQSPDRAPSSWPRGWSMQSVERRWLLLMAHNSGEDSDSTSLLGVDETLGRYDQILQEVTTSDHSLALLKKQKGAAFLIGELSSRFIALRLQANPVAIPLLDDVIQLCTKLKKLPEKKIREKEKNLFSMRLEAKKRAQAIESYLDWIEAAKLPVRSGLFDKLLKSPESSVQKGPIGRYLDTVEARGW